MIKHCLLSNFLMTNTFSDNNQIEVVSSFSELVNSKFQGEMNALCWHRNLVGDFKEIVAKLELKENITEVSIEDLLALQLSEKGNLAREIILKDIQLLTDFGASPDLTSPLDDTRHCQCCWAGNSICMGTGWRWNIK